MRYSSRGKPLCSSCRKLATHRTPYRSKNDAGKVEQGYIYHCQVHCHNKLSERLLTIEILTPVEVEMHDVVRYRGRLYRVMGKGTYASSFLTSLTLQRIGPGNGLRFIDIDSSVYYPQISLVKKCLHDWREEQSVLSRMEYRAAHIIAARHTH